MDTKDQWGRTSRFSIDKKNFGRMKRTSLTAMGILGQFQRNVLLAVYQTINLRNVSINCIYVNYVNCKSVGHLAKVCYKNKNHYVSVEEYYEFINMFKIERVVEDSKPIMIKVQIEKKEIEMEIDSGARVSILPKEVYETILSHVKLEHTNSKLKRIMGL